MGCPVSHCLLATSLRFWELLVFHSGIPFHSGQSRAGTSLQGALSGRCLRHSWCVCVLGVPAMGEGASRLAISVRGGTAGHKPVPCSHAAPVTGWGLTGPHCLPLTGESGRDKSNTPLAILLPSWSLSTPEEKGEGGVLW